MKKSSEAHAIHDFILQSQLAIENKYQRIQKRATEDPGTAGDEGEESWADLLRNWLPPFYQVVTRGRIVTESGYCSPQLDVIVLKPCYPKLLLHEKLYLAGGVAAVFECKTTLKALHIAKIAETAAQIRKNSPMRTGTPYSELCSELKIGLLAHSHSWKGKNSSPSEVIEERLFKEDRAYADHPRQSLDFLCVADLALWHSFKCTYRGPFLESDRYSDTGQYGSEGQAMSGFFVNRIGGTLQKNYYSPVGAFLTYFYQRLSWDDPALRAMAAYFWNTGVGGAAFGKHRIWDLSIYSCEVARGIKSGKLVEDLKYSEWATMFL